MGNAFHKVTQAFTLDPIARKLDNRIAAKTLLPPPPAPPPAYDPSKDPGRQLYAAPAGGPSGGGPPGSLFSGGAGVQPGYAPNAFQTGAGAGPGAPRSPPTAFLGRGGSSTYPQGGPPMTANVNQGMPPGGPTNPQLQQQMMIAQMLRGQSGRSTIQ